MRMKNTSLRAGLKVRRQSGNRLITIRHRRSRNIAFKMGKRRYRFDPNRIFTRRGIELTLKKYSQYDKDAAREVNRLAKTIIQYIGAANTIIALHNNRGYSIRDYFCRA